MRFLLFAVLGGVLGLGACAKTPAVVSFQQVSPPVATPVTVVDDGR